VATQSSALIGRAFKFFLPCNNMKKVIKIDYDFIWNGLFENDFEIDESPSRDDIVFPEGELEQFLVEIGDRIKTAAKDEEVEIVKTGFYCRYCGCVYEQDNEKDVCDECLELQS